MHYVHYQEFAEQDRAAHLKRPNVETVLRGKRHISTKHEAHPTAQSRGHPAMKPIKPERSSEGAVCKYAVLASSQMLQTSYKANPTTLSVNKTPIRIPPETAVPRVALTPKVFPSQVTNAGKNEMIRMMEKRVNAVIKNKEELMREKADRARRSVEIAVFSAGPLVL
ncbi:unnamed protein product [Gongylonema pulchrum]|uniref:TPX2 domain-containing protein n=1 Tax=Gongylonema pulchrum TaxID=637853 RepID=A0A183EFB8_9BILA|nr:unnamed protein product [Gongylonema pulchrum]